MMVKKYVFAALVPLLVLLCACGAERPVPSALTQTEAPAETSAVYAQTETQTNVAADAPAQTQEAKLYADYLANGGYESILYDYDDPEAEFEAEAALADINDDGVRELLMHMANHSAAGVRGFPSVSVLLGIRNGKVEQLGFADYGGGSGGGDYLRFKYDTRTRKHVLEYEEYVRDGMFFSTYALHYFDTARIDDAQEKQFGLVGAGDVRYKIEHTVRCSTFYKDGAYSEDAERVRSESDLCKEEDGFVTAYLYDDSYISEAEYNGICARYTEPTDPAYQMKPVTLENPIPTD